MDRDRKERLKRYGFDLDAQRKAESYEKEGFRLRIFSSLFFGLVLGLFARFGSESLVGWLASFSEGYLLNCIYVSIVVLGLSLLNFPFSWLSYRRELRFDLSNQAPSAWLVDQIKGVATSFVIALILLPPFLLLLSHLSWWWLIAWAGFSLFSLLLSYIGPVLLMPIFYDFQPLEDDELESDLEELAERAEVDVVGAFEMGAGEKTKKAVGGLTGIGSTRRIILSDTLLENYSRDEIEGVIAHELGHHVRGDLWKNVIESSLVSLVLLYLLKVLLPLVTPLFALEAGTAALPVIFLLGGAFSALTEPLENFLSRLREIAADSFAVKLTDKPRPFADALIKLNRQNLGNAAPSPLVEFLFYDHPSGLKRVEQVLEEG